MRSGLLASNRNNPKRYLLLSVLLPMLLVAVGWIVLEVHPFGTRQILVTDFWHQYYPFLCILQEKLKHGESLLYTWQSGMGSNFAAMMAYYTASPLNLLTLLVPVSMLRDTVTGLVLLKIGAAGGFFAAFLKGTYGRNDSSLCLFGTMYALCDFMMGYSWNIIWLDTVAMLPLVMLGVVRLVRTGSYRLYTISLALAMLANFYIGFFICIFTVIAYFCICIFTGMGFKRFLAWQSAAFCCCQPITPCRIRIASTIHFRSIPHSMKHGEICFRSCSPIRFQRSKRASQTCIVGCSVWYWWGCFSGQGQFGFGRKSGQF